MKERILGVKIDESISAEVAKAIQAAMRSEAAKIKGRIDELNAGLYSLSATIKEHEAQLEEEKKILADNAKLVNTLIKTYSEFSKGGEIVTIPVMTEDEIRAVEERDWSCI